MFGQVDITLQAAPGKGIVSSVVLESDDLDEIDWEWLGANPTQVQTNYFGKGITGTYNRAAWFPNPGNEDGFHTYTINWNAQRITWAIDGTVVRQLGVNDAAAGQYPQTPMMVKVGAWSGGDPSNAPGTIAWAGGPTDYSAGPFSMIVKSLTVTDASTGTQYKYGDMTGNWQSIVAAGGTVNSGGVAGSGAAAAAPQPSSQAAPAPASSKASVAPAPASTQQPASSIANVPVATTIPSSIPLPWAGTQQTTSTWVMPSVYPWVPRSSGFSTETTTLSGLTLPSGYTINGSGKVIPPSGASASRRTNPILLSCLAIFAAFLAGTGYPALR
jgi:beta-glucanase (GH16 family)